MSVELLSKVEYSNLLSINWNEQKIQTNFRLIVDALGMQQQTNSSLQSQIDRLREEMVNARNKVQTKVQSSMKEVVAPAASSKSIGPQPPAQSSDKIVADLAKEIQKKMAEKQKELASDVNSLKSEIDRLKSVIAGLQNKQGEKQQSLKNIEAASRKSIYQPVATVPPIQTGPTQSDLDEISRKIASLLEDIGRISEDNIRTNAKLNIQEQNIDSLKKTIQAYGPVVSSNPDVVAPTTAIPNSISNKKLQTEQVRRPSIKTRPSKITVASVKDITNQQNKPETQDSRYENMEGQLNSLLLDMGTLKFCYQQLKLLIGDSRRSEQKRGSKLDSLYDKHQALKQKVQLEKDRVDREFKNIRLAMSEMMTISEPTVSEIPEKQESVETTKPPSPTNRADQRSDIRADQRNTVSGMRNSRRDSDTAKLNERIGKLHALMVNSVTLSEFDRLKSEMNDRLAEINKILQSQLPQLKDQIADLHNVIKMTDEKLEKQISRVEDDTQKVFTAVGQRATAADKKINVTNSRIEELKKDIQYMKEDLQYYKNSLIKTEPTDSKTVSKEDEVDKSSIDVLKKKMEDMKKQYTNKIHDLRTELVGAIRDFEKKMANKNTNDQQIGQLQQKLEEIKLYLSRKADLEDTKKSLLYLDKKLSVVLTSLNKEDESTEDARAAKKSWFCLSCDKVLEGYSGKVGRHIPWDALSPKNIMKVTQISTTMRIDDKKRKDPLPTLGSSLKK